MTQWEYRQETCASQEALMTAINKLGRSGWEVASVVYTGAPTGVVSGGGGGMGGSSSSTYYSAWTAILKRPRDWRLLELKAEAEALQIELRGEEKP